ncbi:uncharacterized protein LOC109803681 [Cajanus cajan]|uniref:mTERF domain-containing protein 1, mitochondrial n=1 Tax=Cajanus cajan TaxID=3821 RepID=A0A151T769_CAJCA|nr:uncharacterized protein LOC109803681 [Cajanus cajan]KYP62877.1 hypothetical protein KK1_017436 [Cajanus cajan]
MFGQCRRALLCNLNPKLNPFTCLQSFTSSAQQEAHSFTYAYLLNNCGFPPKTASHLSTRLRLSSSATPDGVLALFRSHGLSAAEIRRIVETYPNLLLHKSLQPKFSFLRSKGATDSDLVLIITKNPRILHFSLPPRYHLIHRFTLSDSSTLCAIKSCPSILYSNNPSRNIDTLLRHNVPHSKISMLLRYWASSLVAAHPSFHAAVLQVLNLGFNPNQTLFLVALRAKLVRKSLWDSKIQLYKKWGWSEEIVLSTFLRNPWCMLASEAKIEAMMGFCVRELGWDSLLLAKHSVLIALSLEKRVVPRASVLRFLLSKRLLKDVNWAAAFIASEDVFLKKFVLCFHKDASQLLKLYQEKRDAPR